MLVIPTKRRHSLWFLHASVFFWLLTCLRPGGNKIQSNVRKKVKNKRPDKSLKKTRISENKTNYYRSDFPADNRQQSGFNNMAKEGAA